MDIRFGSDFTVEQLAECSNDAFANYIGGPIVFTPEDLAAYLPINGIQLARSPIMYDTDTNRPIGFAFMAYRDDLPTEARLGGMGVVADWVGKGVGTKLLTAVIDATRSDGIKTIWLEVFQQNAPAVKLYTRFGFEIVRPLVGWEKPAAAADDTDAAPQQQQQQLPSQDLEETTPAEVLALVRKHAAEDLPWQLWSQFGLTKKPLKSRVFRLGQAYCAVTDPEDESKNTASLQALIVEPEARGRGQGTALLRAVLEKFPGKAWQVPRTVPQEYGDVIAQRLGFTLYTLNQYQMRLRI